MIMEEKNIGRDNQPGQQNKDLEERGQQSREQENTGEDVNVSNPQEGTQWNNYRSRELSTNENSSSSESMNDE
jgi:hypothetical protein